MSLQYDNARMIVELQQQRDELLTACQAALPQLEWANSHGSRGEEILAQCQCAILNATHAQQPLTNPASAISRPGRKSTRKTK